MVFFSENKNGELLSQLSVDKSIIFLVREPAAGSAEAKT